MDGAGKHDQGAPGRITGTFAGSGPELNIATAATVDDAVESVRSWLEGFVASRAEDNSRTRTANIRLTQGSNVARFRVGLTVSFLAPSPIEKTPRLLTIPRLHQAPADLMRIHTEATSSPTIAMSEETFTWGPHQIRPESGYPTGNLRAPRRRLRLSTVIVDRRCFPLEASDCCADGGECRRRDRQKRDERSCGLVYPWSDRPLGDADPSYPKDSSRDAW
jgi:hypothetical protein